MCPHCGYCSSCGRHGYSNGYYPTSGTFSTSPAAQNVMSPELAMAQANLLSMAAGQQSSMIGGLHQNCLTGTANSVPQTTC